MANRKKRFIQFYVGSKNPIILVVFMLLLIVSGNKSQAQTYQEARTLAFKGEHEKAREMCRAILASEFDSDVAVLMARTYAWDSKYDSARVIIASVLKRDPSNWDALDAISDVQYWDKKYQDAIGYCDVALAKNANDEHFMLKKGKIFQAMGNNDQAAGVLETLLKNNPANAEARNKLAAIRLDLKKNTVRLSYTYDFFEKKWNQDPWQLTALSYGRKTPIGTIIGRVNMANRFGLNGFQYEMDAYPTINGSNYAYLNFGYSDISIFPKFRAGAEWYHSFPKAFEASLGMRALYYSLIGSNTYVFTGTAGKYVGNYWFSLRAYVTPTSTKTSASASIQARRYFSDPENYIGLRLGYGISPDDRRYGDRNSDYLTFKSQSVKLEYNHIFSKIWTTNLGATLSNEEYPIVGYILHTSFEIGIGRFF